MEEKIWRMILEAQSKATMASNKYNFELIKKRLC